MNSSNVVRNLEKLKFGLVGAGAIAQSYVRAFQDSNEASLVAVADVRPEAAQAIAQRVPCKAYNSHLHMVTKETLDAVIVCTPPSTHPEVCVDLLRSKVHVLCEKPLSIDSEGVRFMIDAAHKADRTLTMASKFRYVEDVAQARRLMLSGLIGEVILFENAFTSRVDMSSRWNANPKVSGGGVLIDNGTHSVDLMRYFLGPLMEVDVVEGKRSQSLAVEETVRIFAKSESGIIGNVDLSWSISKESASYIDIYGSEGMLSVGWKESKYRLYSNDQWVVFGKGYDKVQAFRSQIDNFSRSLRGLEPLVITEVDAAASVQAIESAYAALRSKRWTPIATVSTTRKAQLEPAASAA
jgi:predicted dehydrogenase